MTIHVGFTGTQQGMTPEQKATLSECLRLYLVINKNNDMHFHHGDCIGADAEAHDIAASLGYTIHIHIPTIESKRAFCKPGIVYPPAPYLERNHAIVDACNILYATPKEYVEQLRSGTWATIRYAKKQDCPIRIILPYGDILTEE